MKKTTTIQISVYDGKLKEEIIFEVQIGCIKELLTLFYKCSKKVKYKTTTDKNGYYNKSRCLFKKELSEKELLIKLIATDDLIKLLKEERKAIEEAELKKKEQELIWMQWLETNLNFTIEQLNSMSEVELENRLAFLYEQSYLSGKFEDYLYGRSVDLDNNEITYIESKVSSEIVDRAYATASKNIFGEVDESWHLILNQNNIPSF